MADVVFRTPREMNLLGYFLRSALRRSAASPDVDRLLRDLDARVLIETAGMQVTLVLAPGRLEIALGELVPVTARVSGSMTAFLGALRTGRFVFPVLLGRVRVRGPIGVLLALLRLFRR